MKKIKLFLSIFLLNSMNSTAQVYNMSNTTIDFGCGENLSFYDSGGQANVYQDDEDLVMVFLPSAFGVTVSVSFDAFSLEQDYDYLYIHDGHNLSYPIIGTYTGTDLPPNITANNSLGALTFHFISDGSQVSAGFEAIISGGFPLPTVTGTSTYVSSCNSILDNGTIDLDVNGSAPFDFSWSNGQTTEDLSNLTTGVYNCVVTDVNGCISNYQDTVFDAPSYDTNVIVNACDSYELNGQVYTNSGNYSQTFNTIYGCDSIINLQVIINNFNLNVIQSGSTIYSLQSNVSYQWVNCATNQPISGEISQQFSTNVPGDYAVILSSNSCSDTSNCINLDFTSINEKSLSNITIYPNPATDNLNIMANSIIESILLYSNDGRIIKNVPSEGNYSQEINLSYLNPGSYFLVINGTKQKLIKL